MFVCAPVTSKIKTSLSPEYKMHTSVVRAVWATDRKVRKFSYGLHRGETWRDSRRELWFLLPSFQILCGIFCDGMYYGLSKAHLMNVCLENIYLNFSVPFALSAFVHVWNLYVRRASNLLKVCIKLAWAHISVFLEIKIWPERLTSF